MMCPKDAAPLPPEELGMRETEPRNSVQSCAELAMLSEWIVISYLPKKTCSTLVSARLGVESRGFRVQRVEGGGWRVEGGGWRVEGGELKIES
jgi:hypothetical protein